MGYCQQRAFVLEIRTESWASQQNPGGWIRLALQVHGRGQYQSAQPESAPPAGAHASCTDLHTGHMRRSDHGIRHSQRTAQKRSVRRTSSQCRVLLSPRPLAPATASAHPELRDQGRAQKRRFRPWVPSPPNQPCQPAAGSHLHRVCLTRRSRAAETTHGACRPHTLASCWIRGLSGSPRCKTGWQQNHVSLAGTKQGGPYLANSVPDGHGFFKRLARIPAVIAAKPFQPLRGSPPHRRIMQTVLIREKGFFFGLRGLDCSLRGQG